MDFMDMAYVNYYREIEEEKEEYRNKLKNIADYLRRNGETEDALNDACCMFGITSLSPNDMMYIKSFI